MFFSCESKEGMTIREVANDDDDVSDRNLSLRKIDAEKNVLS